MTSSPTPAVLPDARAREVRLRLFLEILSASCGQADASDYRWNWINAFCGEHEGYEPDTFNTAHDAGYTTVSHDNDTDSGIARLTDAGRAYLATPPASDAAVPAGEDEVRIPREPTDVMMNAGLYHSSRDTEWSDCNTMWKAMFDAVTLDGGSSAYALAAAPKVASDTGAGLVHRALTEALEAIEVFERCYDQFWDSLPDGWDFRNVRAVATAGDVLRIRIAALATPADVTDGATQGKVQNALQAIKAAARYVPIGDGYFDPHANAVEAIDAAVDRLAKLLSPAAVAVSDAEDGCRQTDGSTGGGEVDPMRAAVERQSRVNKLAQLMIDTWKRVDPNSGVAKHTASYVATFADMARAIVDQDATTPGGDLLEQAARAAECAFDDRPRSRVGHPSHMDWEDGFREGTQSSAAAIRALSARNQTDDGGVK